MIKIKSAQSDQKYINGQQGVARGIFLASILQKKDDESFLFHTARVDCLPAIEYFKGRFNPCGQRNHRGKIRSLEQAQQSHDGPAGLARRNPAED